VYAVETENAPRKVDEIMEREEYMPWARDEETSELKCKSKG